jgi:hypothetical protein
MGCAARLEAMTDIEFPAPKTKPLTKAELAALRAEADEGRVTLKDFNAVAKRNGAKAETPHGPKLIDPRTIKPRNIEWLIRDRLAFDMLTLLVGHGGVGKGVCWINWIARISRGELGERKNTLISAPEDVHDTMLVPRLHAADADLEHVRLIDSLRFPNDEAWLEQQIAERRACLLVCDPVLTHLSAKTDSYRDHDVKLALTPLLQMAARTRCAVLGVVHFTKSTERGAFLSIQASGAFGNTARHVLGMVDHPDDNDGRVLSVVKTNIASRGLSWRMRVETKPVEGLDDPVPTLVEDGDSNESVDDLLAAGRSRAVVSPQKLRELVLRELACGEKSRDHLNQVAGDELGASADMVYRNALAPLRASGSVKPRKEGIDGKWHWSVVA